ncbi:unnamed protein product [Laminaria digitata]
MYCKQHAVDGMVHVCSRRCMYDSCTKVPYFNVGGSKTAVYCKQHAEDGMVDVYRRRCSEGSCKRLPRFNVEGSKTATHCKHHAEDGMVNVSRRRCSHDACTRTPSWELLTDGAATVCARHRSDGLGCDLINFRVICQVAGCGRESRWGLHGQQPTHCPHHGPSKDGLVCTVRTPASKRARSNPSSRPATPPIERKDRVFLLKCFYFNRNSIPRGQWSLGAFD